jgi:transmembrane protein TMEM260 (protein O-mannosyltransferase)
VTTLSERAAVGPDAAALEVRSTTWAASVAAVGVGLAALALCLWRLMPGVGFWDTAEFQMVLPVMGTAHPTGYPTYVLIGWLASVVLQPLGEAALRTNVLSAILVAAGAAFVTDLARRVSGSLVFGVIAGIGTALTPIVWDVGTHADPHALHFLFVAVILWLLVRWEDARRGSPVNDDVVPAADSRRADRLLLIAAVIVGLSIGNHSLTLLLGPPIALFVLAVDPQILKRPRFVAAGIAAVTIPTVLVRFEMVLRAGWFRAPFVYADPSTWSGFWYVTLGEQFHGWLTDPFSRWDERFAQLFRMASTQLGPLALLVVVAFVLTAIRRPRYALLTGVALVLTCFFNSVYPDGAIDRYYIGPAVIAWTWLALLGSTAVAILTERLGGPDGIGTSVSAGRLARAVAVFAVAGLLIAPSIQAFGPRSRAMDRTTDVLGARWTDEVLSVLEPNAVVVSWWSYSTPLWYATIVDGRRPDILIIDDRNRLDQNLGELDQVIARYLPTRPVYLVRNGTSELPAVEARYSIEPAGRSLAMNLLQVHPLESGAVR